MERQLSGRGLLEEGGRGLSMMLSLANLVAFNVDPGTGTEVVVVAAADHPEGRTAVALNAAAHEDVRTDAAPRSTMA